ncbi:hypothetical protein [Lichenibacterium dinghuense]|uniref:hypothetical protein n=1 Tax=Lichenibacterium dinghuense TaxID=2895977 RepID=UPI001F2F9539|nr:hypothetical protein [Lichenibacterium sp. 6Y81]
MAKIIGGKQLQPYLQGMADRLSKAKTVDVGFLEGATYPDGTSVPTVAALNEFGTSKAPPRPFFRTMIAAKQGEWGPASGHLLKANNYDAAKTLDQAGAAVAGQLRQSILTFDGAPLAPATVKAKGFATPLIDTGHMSNSVDHRVNSGDE